MNTVLNGSTMVPWYAFHSVKRLSRGAPAVEVARCAGALYERQHIILVAGRSMHANQSLTLRVNDSVIVTRHVFKVGTAGDASAHKDDKNKCNCQLHLALAIIEITCIGKRASNLF